MKRTYDREWLQRILDSRETVIKIVSGEGVFASKSKPFRGSRTVEAVRRAIETERRGGDRWAYAYIRTPDRTYKLWGDPILIDEFVN